MLAHKRHGSSKSTSSRISATLFAPFIQGKQPQAEAIHSVIKNVFLALDDEIVTKPAQLLIEQPEGTPLRAMAANILQTARAGSCALVAFYDSNVRSLHVPSSAIPAPYWDGGGKPTTGRRGRAPGGGAPGRDAVQRAGPVPRVGDHPLLWQWGVEVEQGAADLHAGEMPGRQPRDTVKTPPYATAMPEITTTAIEPGDFMVMASDGLWDCLTNEEVVGLVGLWLKRQDDGVANMQSTGEEQIVERAHLPVELKDDNLDGNYEYWKAKKQFVNVDSNVARHLARNALGGADKDLHTALLSTPAPRHVISRTT
ncbi:hypothetical protein B0H13DRAFT_2515085 [Mycena leptocephala]|nr:hypothetical protein B0H13DRAFT_2515085 [Mycena leptocephala]